MDQFIAIDLGAESGRVIIGKLEENKLSLEEIHRFQNGPIKVFGHLFWNPLGLFNEMKLGIYKAARQYGAYFVSIGVDTWGIDYALLDKQGNLIGNPYCYRDRRTEGMMEMVFNRIPRQEIYKQSAGIQFMPINALYQVYSMVVNDSPQLDCASTFLMIPDLFNYWLTGRKVCEFTDTTTTQFYNALEGDWSKKMLSELGIPIDIFPEVIQPGTELGTLLPDISVDIGVNTLPIIAPATHDTASAVVAVPAEGSEYAWLSSGTWSLFGGISNKPLVHSEALTYNFSSYGGVENTFLPWKNIMGLWLVQECRRIWAREGDQFSYDELTQLAAMANPFTAIIEPDDLTFLAPAHMPEAIQAFCKRTGQTVPQSKGEIIRTVLEGLALKYRWTFEKLQIILGKELHSIHIVGGGTKNCLLCQFTADVTQLPVIAGPIEATAIGNIIVQAVAKRYFSSVNEAKHLIKRSFSVIDYEPGNSAQWDDAYEKYKYLHIQNL